MINYEEVVKSLRQCCYGLCEGCKHEQDQEGCRDALQKEAADAIEELIAELSSRTL